MNKSLVLIVITCLLLSLLLPAIEAEPLRQRGKSGKSRSASRSRNANARRAQAMALRAARARQAARRGARQEELSEDEYEVVEDESSPTMEGVTGTICEAVIFTKEGDVIDFKYVNNKC